MKYLIALLLLVKVTCACNKVACAAYIGACGGICTCDFPVCECCPQCVACAGAMWAECCSCFGKCDSYLPKTINHTLLVVTDQGMVTQNTNFIPLRTANGCDGATNHATCLRCVRRGGPVTMNYCECHGDSCQILSRADICCAPGQSASCHCTIDGVAICSC